MGTQSTTMALKLLVLVALAAYKCDALPSATDLVVPEGMMMQVAFSSMTPTAFLSAMTKSGGTKEDCGTFASTTVADIKTAVSSEQKVLNEVANGDDCAAEGQTLVTKTKAAVVSAQADVVTKQGLAATALTAKKAACSAGVDFSVGLEALEANSCYDYTSQTGYTQAKATCDSATTSLKTADANVATAQTVVTDYQATAADAVAEAARLESGCLCNAHKRQTAAWASATTDHASHAADWKQAHEILCALDSATTSCNFDACPTVAKPRVAAGVENAEECDMCGCSGESNGIKCSMTDAERSCDQDAVCDGQDEVTFGDWAKLCTPKADLDMCMCTGNSNEYECTQTGKGHCGNTQRCVRQQDNKDVEVKYGDWSKICFEEE